MRRRAILLLAAMGGRTLLGRRGRTEAKTHNFPELDFPADLQ
jgi:hypothetical protein